MKYPCNTRTGAAQGSFAILHWRFRLTDDKSEIACNRWSGERHTVSRIIFDESSWIFPARVSDEQAGYQNGFCEGCLLLLNVKTHTRLSVVCKFAGVQAADFRGVATNSQYAGYSERHADGI